MPVIKSPKKLAKREREFNEIRKLRFEENWPIEDLMEEFGRSQQFIYKAIRGVDKSDKKPLTK